MHKVSDDDLFWAFRGVIAGLGAERLNNMKRGFDGAGRQTVGELVAALRRQRWEVIEFKAPLPMVNDRAANDWQYQRGLADERAVREIIDALCALTDKRLTASDIAQMALPALGRP